MKLSEVAAILGATVLTQDADMDREVLTACGSDMMSDVLAYVKDQGLLLTGLCNPQVVRTSEMMDIICVTFVRGKMPDEMTLELAERKNIVVLATDHRMYEACGMLYAAGLGRADS